MRAPPEDCGSRFPTPISTDSGRSLRGTVRESERERKRKRDTIYLSVLVQVQVRRQREMERRTDDESVLHDGMESTADEFAGGGEGLQGLLGRAEVPHANGVLRDRGEVLAARGPR